MSSADLQLLIAQSGAKVDHEALVRDIRAVSEEGANRYLEHVVVGRKSPNRTLHRDLLDRLLTRLEKEVSDEGIRYHLEELGELDWDLQMEHRLMIRCRISHAGRSRTVLRLYR